MKPNSVDQELERSTFLAITTIGGLVIAGLLQIYAWDKYALSIIPLQILELTGQSTASDWEKMAAHCIELKKWDCAEEQYKKAAQNDDQLYLRLAEFQAAHKRWERAARSFGIHFSKSPKVSAEHLEPAITYAKILTELGQGDEAAQFYELALAAKPESLQVPVIHSYVKLLFRDGNFARARGLIEEVRKSSSTAAQFMDSEYQQILKVKTAAR